MSKLFANKFLQAHPEVDLERLKAAEQQILVQFRYLWKEKLFRIKCLDVLTYLSEGIIQKADFRIPAKVLVSKRMFDVDNKYIDSDVYEMISDDLTNYRYVRDVEKGSILTEEQYYNICFFQKYYYFTPNVLKEIKKQAHLYKLKRNKTPWYHLTPYHYCTGGGRPVGSKSKLPDEDRERLLDELPIYPNIVKKYVSKGILERFLEMHYELTKLPVEDLPEPLNMKFMKNKTAIKWYYFALRYEWKVSEGIPPEKINPGLKEIREKQKVYGFPFKYAE